jgi:microcystin-dependent protein
MPYAGALPPLNWLLCDGTEHSQSTYTELYQIIGNIYGAAGPGLFRVPDLRGRFPLGKDNMGGTGANNVAAGQADQLGGFSGDDDKEIAVANLPQHTHDLRGPSGTQYYATLDGSIPPGDTATVSVDAPTATSAGAGLPNAGNVVSGTIGQRMDVMNPYLTLNYCIFTGQS